MRTLPRANGSDLVEVSHPTKSFDSIVIDPELRGSLEQLRDEWSIREQLARNGLKPRNRLLFYGPPGNGKTMAAQCLAALFELPLLVVRCENLIDCWMGSSEKNAAAVFTEIEREPAVAFFDEADSFFAARMTARQGTESARNNMVNIMLQRLDRLKPTSIVIAATNRYDDLDPAIVRRFDNRFLFPSPSAEQKQRYLEQAIAAKPIFRKRRGDVAEAMKLDAPSFAELELALNDLARRIVIKQYLK